MMANLFLGYDPAGCVIARILVKWCHDSTVFIRAQFAELSLLRRKFRNMLVIIKRTLKAPVFKESIPRGLVEVRVFIIWHICLHSQKQIVEYTIGLG